MAPRKAEGQISRSGRGKVARILDCFTRETPALTLTDISRRMQMHPTTVFRLLGTLHEIGYVSVDSQTKQYRLGLKLLDLGMRVRSSLDLGKEADELLHNLADATGESTYLSISRDGKVVYIAAVDSAQTIKTSAVIGEQRPLHSTGAGKIFLAFMSPEQRAQQLLEPLVQRGPATITDPAVLESVLAEVRRTGRSACYEEDQVGLVSVAAPVFGPGGLVAALSLAGPAFRIPREELGALGDQVVAAAAQLSRRLGAPAPLALR